MLDSKAPAAPIFKKRIFHGSKSNTKGRKKKIAVFKNTFFSPETIPYKKQSTAGRNSSESNPRPR